MIDYASFVQKQVEYIARCPKSWLNVAEGGKRAGKNVINILAWALQLEQHPDKLHLASGVSIATAKLNIIDSNGFGLKFWFAGRCHEGKYQQRDALYLNTIAGEKIILISGGGKEGDEKLIKGNTYGTAYVTEANECAAPFVKEVFDRTLSSSNRQIYFDINPKNPNQWFYTDVLNPHMKSAEKYPDYRMNYGHFTLFDNLSIPDGKLKEILRTYDKKSLWYKRDILGKRVAPDGVIYDMFVEAENTYDEIPMGVKDVSRRSISIDYGTTNPMVFCDFYDDGTTIWLDRMYYWSSKEEGKQKTDSQYADDLIEFLGEQTQEDVVLDPSAASFKAELRQRGVKVRDADNDVNDGIRMMATAIGRRLLKVNRRCRKFIDEVEGYVWDDKAAARGEEKPKKENDHVMDASRYYVKTKIKAWRLAN